MDGHPTLVEGVDRIPPTGRLTVNRQVMAKSSNHVPTNRGAAMSGTLRELPPSKRDGQKRWQLRVYVGRDPDKTVRDENGRVAKQGPPVHVSRVFRGGRRSRRWTSSSPRPTGAVRYPCNCTRKYPVPSGHRHSA
jgi:hypothetical protein